MKAIIHVWVRESGRISGKSRAYFSRRSGNMARGWRNIAQLLGFEF